MLLFYYRLHYNCFDDIFKMVQINNFKLSKILHNTALNFTGKVDLYIIYLLLSIQLYINIIILVNSERLYYNFSTLEISTSEHRLVNVVQWTARPELFTDLPWIWCANVSSQSHHR